MKRIVPAVVALLLLAFTGVSATDQWPQFRGKRAGVADDDPMLPDTWGEVENVAWRTSIPGLGWSSPVVWDDHIFVTSAISAGSEPTPIKGLADPTDENGAMRTSAVHRWMIYDIEFNTGRIRWQRELQTGVPSIPRHVRNSYATETPVTDGKRVYVYFGSIGLVAALNLDGSIAWTKDIGAFEGTFAWGRGDSPALFNDRLFIVNDNRTQSFITALDTSTGEEMWRVNRDEREGYSTPVVWENDLRTEVVSVAARSARSYGLDGSLLWQINGLSTFGTIATPVATRGLVYLSAGYPGNPQRPVFAIRPGASGAMALKSDAVGNQHVAWFQPLLGSYQTSPLVYDGYYYTLLDRGFLLCHDAQTGKQIYGRQRVSADTSGFAVSPWAYNGKIFALSEDGDTYVLQAGPQFKLLATNSLNEMAMATPAISQRSLIIRTQSNLYRIARRATP